MERIPGRTWGGDSVDGKMRNTGDLLWSGSMSDIWCESNMAKTRPRQGEINIKLERLCHEVLQLPGKKFTSDKCYNQFKL